MSLAPIGICTYTRLNHLIQSIDALKANTLAQQSEIYIFSDGPRPGDEAKVQELRDYLKTVNGFKKVHLRLQPVNNMLENNANAHIHLATTHGKSIFLEDDIVTSPHFLEFINNGLERYESNKKVMSIGGYCHPISLPKNYPYDVFFSPIFCPWGVGTWRDRFELVDKVKNAWNGKKDPKLASDIKYIGKDLLRRYKSLCKENIKAADLLAKYDFVFTAAMVQHQMFTVLPRQSLIENIGFDGSGVHCNVKDTRFARTVDASFRPVKFSDNATLNPVISRQLYLLSSFSNPPQSAIKKSLYLLQRYLAHKFSL